METDILGWEWKWVGMWVRARGRSVFDALVVSFISVVIGPHIRAVKKQMQKNWKQ